MHSEEKFPLCMSMTPHIANEKHSGKRLRRHFEQQNSLNLHVHFDSVSKTKSNGKIIAVSSNPLRRGVYKWTLEIMRSDVEIQELGVCTNADIKGIDIDDDGVSNTVALGARGVYGSELATNSLWYASFNKDGARRCHKDLTPYYQIGWTAKDQIKVVLNMDKWRIKFYLNGKKVRKVLSLQANQTYYPFVSFGGKCQYYLH